MIFIELKIYLSIKYVCVCLSIKTVAFSLNAKVKLKKLKNYISCYSKVFSFVLIFIQFFRERQLPKKSLLENHKSLISFHCKSKRMMCSTVIWLFHLENFPGVLKKGDFIDFELLFSNFHFFTLYLCCSHRYTWKISSKSSFLTVTPLWVIYNKNICYAYKIKLKKFSTIYVITIFVRKIYSLGVRALQID